MAQLLATGALVAGALFASAPAHAYCRAVTATPPVNYDPTDAGCFGYSPEGGTTNGLLPLFWRNSCVSFSFQPQDSKYLTVAQAEAVGEEAFNAWSAVTCPGGGSPSIHGLKYLESSCNEVPSAAHSNVIIFRDNVWPYDDASNAIGFTTLTVDFTTGEIVGADTEINSADWDIVAEPPATGNAIDFRTIMTHEAGHFLGLAHSADNTAIMYALYHASTQLQPDDIDAICSIYPPTGLHNTAFGPIAAGTCDPKPLAGFLPDTCGSLDGGGLNLLSIGSGAGVDALNTPCPDPSGCSVGASSAPRSSSSRLAEGAGALGSGFAGLVAFVAMARRARRRRKAAATGASIAVLALSAFAARDAGATVSVGATLEDLVKNATAVAIATPVEEKAAWEGPRVVTMTRLHVDRVVEGALPGDVWVHSLGGRVGNIGQLVEGQPAFALGAPSLVFVRPHVDPATKAATGAFVVVDAAQGQFAVVAGDARGGRLAHASSVGALLPPPGKAAADHLAGELLDGKPLDEAVRAIDAAWKRAHP